MAFLEPNGDIDLNRLVDQLKPVLKHINLHRFVWGLTTISAFIAWNRGLAFLYALVAFLLAALVLSYLLSYLNLKNISIKRNLKDIAEAGQSIDISYQLSSPGTRHFLQIKELFEIDLSLTTTFISHHHKLTKIFSSHTIKQRGLYPLEQIELSCGYPLGVFIRKKKVATSLQQLIIVPQMFHISNLPEIESLHTSDGSIRSRHEGSQDEFAGLREYQRGDSLKNIHWPVTAKQISKSLPWQVKTFETHDQPVILIILNQQDIKGKVFEYMLSIAASIAKHATRKGFRVHLSGMQNHTLWSTDIPSNSKNFLYDIQCMASLQPSQGHYSDTVNNALSQHNKSNLAVVFSSNNNINIPTSVNSLAFEFQTTKKNQKLEQPHHSKWRLNTSELNLDKLSEMFR